MADSPEEDVETEAVLRRSELVRRSIRARRHTANVSSSHSSSPTESSRRTRSQHGAASTAEPRTDSPQSLLIDEARKMPVIGVSKSGVLAQQIHDEFLTCKICLDGFTNPKSLNCLHTFCEECIEHHANSESSYKKYSDYREFTCPLCRKRTTLPLGGVKKLPDNFLVSSLTEVIDRQKPSKFPFCDICKLVNKKHRDASSKCLDCNKLLCVSCVEQHLETKVTRNHNIFDVEIEKEIECKEHSEEVVRFYCETCETAICILCTFNDHKDHDVAQFSDAVQKYKTNIENLLHDCQSKLELFEGQLEAIGRCEQCIKTAEQKIRDVSINMISDIRAREKTLIEEIRNLYGPEMMSLIDKKAESQADYDTLKGTVKLTELIVKGKDMELLLLKREVQNKLEALSREVMHELPTTATKVISYVPGTVDVGFVHDSDNPQLSRMRKAYGKTGSTGQSTEDCFQSVETQTVRAMGDNCEKGVNTTILCTVDEEVQTEPSSPRGGAAAAAVTTLSIVHEPREEPQPEVNQRSRYMTHQSSSIDDDALSARRSRVYANADDDQVAQRRRRRRERARTTRTEPDRYSYPSDSTPSGLYEAYYSGSQNNINGSAASASAESAGAEHYSRRNRTRRYATVDE